MRFLDLLNKKIRKIFAGEEPESLNRIGDEISVEDMEIKLSKAPCEEKETYSYTDYIFTGSGPYHEEERITVTQTGENQYYVHIQILSPMAGSYDLDYSFDDPISLKEFLAERKKSNCALNKTIISQDELDALTARDLQKYSIDNNHMGLYCLMAGIGPYEINYHMVLDSIYKYARNHPEIDVKKAIDVTMEFWSRTFCSYKDLVSITEILLTHLDHAKKGIAPFILDVENAFRTIRKNIENDYKLKSDPLVQSKISQMEHCLKNNYLNLPPIHTTTKNNHSPEEKPPCKKQKEQEKVWEWRDPRSGALCLVRVNRGSGELFCRKTVGTTVCCETADTTFLQDNPNASDSDIISFAKKKINDTEIKVPVTPNTDTSEGPLKTEKSNADTMQSLPESDQVQQRVKKHRYGYVPEQEYFLFPYQDVPGKYSSSFCIGVDNANAHPCLRTEIYEGLGKYHTVYKQLRDQEFLEYLSQQYPGYLTYPELRFTEIEILFVFNMCPMIMYDAIVVHRRTGRPYRNITWYWGPHGVNCGDIYIPLSYDEVRRLVPETAGFENINADNWMSYVK